MIIGLDGSRAFLRYRTGIEEYSYQVIKHLREALPADAEVRVYVRKKLAWHNGKVGVRLPEVDFTLPENWSLVGLWAPRFWTQVRLSLEMLFRPIDTLFIPAHTVPVIHPKNTVVVVHGLEYEMSPKSYSWYARFYMRTSIHYSVHAAQKVIAVSQNTKSDVEKLYGVAPEKIRVIHEGFIQEGASVAVKQDTILFIGRIEERKNISKIVEAFEILKRRDGLPHTLVLVGKPGYGYEVIRKKIEHSLYRNQIKELGYVTREQKMGLLNEANVFIFPSLYEGFGLPILEAQAAGVPVVTSSTSSLPEVAGEGALYVDPENVEDIAQSLALALQESKRGDLIEKGHENLKRFSWLKCAQEIAKTLIS